MKKFLACLIITLLLGGVFGIAVQGTIDKDVAVVDSVIELLSPSAASADTLFMPILPPLPPPIP